MKDGQEAFLTSGLPSHSGGFGSESAGIGGVRCEEGAASVHSSPVPAN
jgi:hypothetical protein